MKLMQLTVLLAVYEAGSFSAAAERLYLSQPSVSLYISSLEAELGYQLFHRTNRGVVPTERGKLVVEQAERIRQAVDAIQNLSLLDGQTLLGSARIGALPHICNTILAALQEELEQYPDFTLSVVSLSADQVLPAVERREVDLGIVQTCDLDMSAFRKKLRRGQLQSGTLAEDTLHFCVSDNHPLWQLEKVTPQDLLQYPYLIYGDTPNPLVTRLYEAQGLEMEPICKHEFIPMRRYAVEHNAFSLLPLRAIHHGNMNYIHQLSPLAVEGIDWHTDVVWLHTGEPLTPTEELLLKRIDNLYRLGGEAQGGLVTESL